MRRKCMRGYALVLALACVMSVSTTRTHSNASSLLDREVEGSDETTAATAVLDEADFDWAREF